MIAVVLKVELKVTGCTVLKLEFFENYFHNEGHACTAWVLRLKLTWKESLTDSDSLTDTFSCLWARPQIGLRVTGAHMAKV